MRNCENAKYHIGDCVVLARKTPHTGRFVSEMDKLIDYHGIIKDIESDGGHIYYRVCFGCGAWKTWWCMEDWLDPVVDTLHKSNELDKMFECIGDDM